MQLKVLDNQLHELRKHGPIYNYKRTKRYENEKEEEANRA